MQIVLLDILSKKNMHIYIYIYIRHVFEAIDSGFFPTSDVSTVFGGSIMVHYVDYFAHFCVLTHCVN